LKEYRASLGPRGDIPTPPFNRCSSFQLGAQITGNHRVFLVEGIHRDSSGQE
jgi:hypothetical protein